MALETVTFSAADGVRLEGRLARPERAAGGVVLCHAHPLYGGSMSSILIPAMQRAIVARGWTALRFNFRGVGRSEGTYGRGVGELADVAGALGLLAASGLEQLAVAGWSFGALVGLAAGVADARVSTIVTVAPPVSMRHEVDLPPLPPQERLDRWKGRALVVCGSEDPFCRPKALQAWVEAIPGAEVRVFAGEDHFFTSGKVEMASAVAGFIVGG